MNAAQVRAKARTAVKRREEQLEQEEIEGGELNLVPYMDIVTNLVIFMLGSLTAGLLLGNINSALPEYADQKGALSTTPPENEEPPLALVVAVTKENIKLFSLSGLEGTLNAPKLISKAKQDGVEYEFTKLSEAALEIVKRRWPKDEDRTEKSFEVVLMADPEISYDIVIKTMDAVRRSPDGTILFPYILFSSGIK